MITEILKYPFNEQSRWILGVGTAMIILMNILAFVPIFGLAFNVVIYGILVSYFCHIIYQAENPGDDAPRWQNISSWWDDLIKPALRISIAQLSSVAPLLIYVLNTDKTDHSMGIIILLLGFAVLNLPMAMIFITATGSSMRSLPFFTIPAIAKTFNKYIKVVFLLVVLLGNILILTAVLENPIVKFIINPFFNMYLLLVAGRLLGLFYKEEYETLSIKI